MIPQTSKSSFATTNTVSETTVPENTQPTTSKPEVSSTTSSASTQPTSNAAAPATEQKGYMEMGEDLMRNSLNRAYEMKNSVRDYIYGSNSQKTIGTEECEQPAPPAPPTINELAKVDTTKLTEAQKFDHYKGLAELGGGQINSEPEARNIVGIRNPTPVDAGKIDKDSLNSKGVYDDTMAVFWTEKDGTKKVQEFVNQVTVDPARKFTETSSQDVNNDKNPDGGRAVPGFYTYEKSTREVKLKNGTTRTEDILRPTVNIPVERDMDGDGLFNDNHVDDKAEKTIYMHTGYNTETGSAGCQTIEKSEFNRFIESFPDDIPNKKNIGYTLVQVGD
ncbi:hypothetical protein L0244_35975 [bacterium]|nr:hypothetical protein [bacterium]